MASTDHRHHAAAASTHAVAKRALVETIRNDTAVGADCPLEYDRIGQKRRPDPRRRHWPELVETSSRQPSARPAPRRLPLRLRDQPRPRHSTTLLVWTKSTTPTSRCVDSSASPASGSRIRSRACRTLAGTQARALPPRQQCGRGDPRFRMGRGACVSATVTRLLPVSDISEARASTDDPRLP